TELGAGHAELARQQAVQPYLAGQGERKRDLDARRVVPIFAAQRFMDCDARGILHPAAMAGEAVAVERMARGKRRIVAGDRLELSESDVADRHALEDRHVPGLAAAFAAID